MPDNIYPKIVCRVCGSADLRRFLRGQTALTECSGCGVVALAAIPSDEERSAYYATHYTLSRDIRADEYAAEMRRWGRLPEQAKLLGDILSRLPPPATILDIGCDRAFFLDEARRFGYRTIGVEPSETARRYAERIGIRVEKNIGDVGEPVHAAVLWHSLEHTGDPVGLLGAVRNIMAPKGLLALRVPDFGSFWSSLLQHRWVWFQPEHHAYHFTAKTLKTVVETAGFSVEFVVSQRPNTLLTLRAGKAAARSFSRYLHHPSSVKRSISACYQYLTGVELYLIARKT